MIIIALFCLLSKCVSGKIQTLQVYENAEIGSLLGTVGSEPPYLIVPITGSVDPDLIINQDSGEIRIRKELDRERIPSYILSAIARNGRDNIEVHIEVLDINDNAPTFKESNLHLNIPENIPANTLRRLIPAFDRDLNEFSTQKYEIISGNTDNIFNLSYSRDSDGLLTLDLIIIGNLDREKIDSYSLEIVAYDGGKPPKTGTLSLSIKILDLNDNSPSFSKQRYFTTISENSPVGTSILQVSATDADLDANAYITYAINRRQSDKDNYFKIEKHSGLLSLQKQVHFERCQVHEIVVVATDGGKVPQETSAFITIRLLNTEENSKELSTGNLKVVPNPPNVFENLPEGSSFAQILSSDYEFISSEDEAFKVIVNESGSYLATAIILDYERKNIYSLTFQNPSVNYKSFVIVYVQDSNDHSPKFEKNEYEVHLDEMVEPGKEILTLEAKDEDEGENGRVSYELEYREKNGDKISDWFIIDETTGSVRTTSYLDCEIESHPKVTIIARDHGEPNLSSRATLTLFLSDGNNNNYPLFRSSYYKATLAEDHPHNICFLNVTATDVDCGVYSQRLNYSFQGPSEMTSDFIIHQNNGQLCVKGQLDYERISVYDFSVTASDSGGRTSSTMVKVEVLNTNDNSPIFLPSQYNVRISHVSHSQIETSTMSYEPLCFVLANDEDFVKETKINYELMALREEDENPFILNGSSGALSLRTTPLKSEYHYQIRALDEHQKSSEKFASLNIFVDFNSYDDHIDSKILYEFIISEDVSPYSYVGSVNSGLSNLSIYDSNAPNSFSLNSETGVLRSESRLDHERYPTVLLNVKGFKDAYTTQDFYFQIQIHIQDVNDNTPEFGFETAYLSLPENLTLGTVFFVAEARDNDFSQNGNVHYRCTSETLEVFSINSKTGEVFLEKSLDYEKNDRHDLLIEAFDNGSPSLSSSILLKLHVIDVNDNSPFFDESQYSLSLSSSQIQKSQGHLMTLFAHDNDSGKNGKISYSLFPNDGFLSIFPNSGVIYLKDKGMVWDKYERMEYVVTATDHGTPPLVSSVPLTLHLESEKSSFVVSQNDSYSLSILENLPAASIVGTIGTKMKGSSFSFRLKTVSKEFRIDSDSGIIYTLKSLDREEHSHYEVKVIASQNGQESILNVNIDVEDENDNSPLLLSSEVLYIRDGSEAGTLLGQLIAEDPDASSSISFRTQGTCDLLSVSPLGEIRLLQYIKPKSRKDFDLSIEISDNGFPPQKSSVLLYFTFLKESEVEYVRDIRVLKVSESVALGTQIADLSRQERLRSEPYFTILEGNDDGTFILDKMSGSLFTGKKLDAESQDFYALLVSFDTYDERLLSLNISVEYVNDEKPFFEKDPLVIHVPENTEVGSVIHRLKAEDKDRFEKLEYEILEQSPTQILSLTQDSGDLILLDSLDYETNSKYIIVVVVKDGVNSSFHHTVKCTILLIIDDLNDNSPYFVSSSSLRLYSDVSLNTTILSPVVIDEDSGTFGKIHFSIFSGNSRDFFGIDEYSGDLRVLQNLSPTTYRLTLRARDGGGLYSDQILNINVYINEDSSPRFDQESYKINVLESIGPQSLILTLNLVQRSSGHNVVFRLLKGNDFFSLDEYSGEIKTKKPLDRENKDSYTLVALVHNVEESETENSDTTIIIVNVLDTNDNSPVFGSSCKDLTVPENYFFNDTYLHAFIAYDLDEGLNGQISYRLQNTNENFKIESFSGKLFLTYPLDREVKEEYNITIIATDKGFPPLFSICKVKIFVSDMNDNSPLFSQDSYLVTIETLDVPLQTSVGQVNADDKDVGVNGEIIYSLESNQFLSIESTTGKLKTLVALTKETLKDFPLRLIVTAVDGGMDKSLSSKCVLRVKIGNTTNTHAPQFTEFPFKLNISCSPPLGAPLLRLNAFDEDSPESLYYSLANSKDKRFELSSKEGLLTIVSDNEWNCGSIELLEILVTDHGLPFHKSSSGLIEILVGDVGPTLAFQKAVYDASLKENPLIAQEVLRVRALRSDGRKQRLHYSFLTGNEKELLKIDDEMGLISVAKPQLIDFESFQSHYFTIMASSFVENKNLTAYCSLKLQLINMNDNAPLFSQESFRGSVIEGIGKDSEVLQLTAIDHDNDKELTFELLDGNLDDAFVIRSGVIRTNTVLDREIRDFYELTVSVKDSGIPILFTTVKVQITVRDENDNSPHFPPLPSLTINRNTLPGSLIGHLKANDIDSFPQLRYRLVENSKYVAINVFSGQLYLLNNSFPTENKLLIEVEASDEIHVARASFNISFKDDNNECFPKFDSPLYKFSVPSYNVSYPYIVGNLSIDADCSHDWNIKIDESSDQSTFSINKKGNLLVYHGNWKTSRLIVLASSSSFSNSHSLTSSVVILSQRSSFEDSSLRFDDSLSSLSFDSHYQAPTTRMTVSVFPSTENLIFSLSPNPVFRIDSSNGSIYQIQKGSMTSGTFLEVSVKRIGDESSLIYKSLKIPRGESSFEKIVFVNNETSLDLYENENFETYKIPICSLSNVSSSIASSSHHHHLSITSGNDESLFRLEESSLRLNRALDYESKAFHQIIIKMESEFFDLSICRIRLRVKDNNDNSPVFPVSQFVGSIKENAPIGTFILSPNVFDEDSNESFFFWLNSYKNFSVNERNGSISSSRTFDYEIESFFSFKLYVNDSGGHVSFCDVNILIIGLDEHVPKFEESTYSFYISGLASPGDVIGQITARDEDSGPHGQVFYSLAKNNKYFAIDPTRGVITVIQSLDTDLFNELTRSRRSVRELKLVAIAKSAQKFSLESSVFISISIEESLLPIADSQSTLSSGALAAIVSVSLILILLIVVIVLFVLLFSRRRKSHTKTNQSSKYCGSRSHSSSHNTNLELSSPNDSSLLSGFPPQYSEIVLDYEESTAEKPKPRSEISEKSHRSASSGRGSVEDGDDDDVEIRMINEGNYLDPEVTSYLMTEDPDDENDDEDLSQSSVQNSKDYFARLGIEVREPSFLLRGNSETRTLSHFDPQSIYNNILEDSSDKNSVYSAKRSLLLGSVSSSHPAHPAIPSGIRSQLSLSGSLSSIVHSEEEFKGSYNWDYLLDWGPQYEPLAHVFKDISRLRDGTSFSPNVSPNISRNISLPLSSLKVSSSQSINFGRGGFSPIAAAAAVTKDSDLSQSAYSPNFHSALSPLGPKSPSISPSSLALSRRVGTSRKSSFLPLSSDSKKRANDSSLV